MRTYFKVAEWSEIAGKSSERAAVLGADGTDSVAGAPCCE
jgi:hypothetical protein